MIQNPEKTRSSRDFLGSTYGPPVNKMTELVRGVYSAANGGGTANIMNDALVI